MGSVEGFPPCLLLLFFLLGSVLQKEGENLVFLVSGNTLAKRSVKTGIENQDYIEILSRLDTGEKVVNGSLRSLRGGEKVKIVGTVK